MSWTEEVFGEAEEIFQVIAGMPFIRELSDGTLSETRFLYYMAQDAHYLESFARTLAMIASRGPDPQFIRDFIGFSEGALVAERSLHEGFLAGTDYSSIPQSPACHHYIHFLQSTAAVAAVEVAVAAVLPCFWIYKRVGDYLGGLPAVRSNPYQKWIDTYGGEAFGALVTKAIAICNEMASAAGPARRQEMRHAFLTACRLEWLFWDSAWRLEKWN